MLWPELLALFRQIISLLACAACASTFLVGILHMIKIIIMKANVTMLNISILVKILLKKG
jgi:hypothetical protein